MRPESTQEAPGPQTPDTSCSFRTHLPYWQGVPRDLPLRPGKSLLASLGFGQERRREGGRESRGRKKERRKERREEGRRKEGRRKGLGLIRSEVP